MILEQKTTKKTPLPILAMLMIAFTMLLYLNYNPPPPLPAYQGGAVVTLAEMTDAYMVEVQVTSNHAVNRHGQAALDIRQCVDRGDIGHIFKLGDKFALLCEIEGGWGAMICGQDAKGLFEYSSYLVKDGDWVNVLSYFDRNNWTRWTGELPGC
jgi:hypothetical protein